MAPKPKAKRQRAQMPFSAPFKLPGERLVKPFAPEDRDDDEGRVPAYVHQPAKIPQGLKSAVAASGLNYKPELPYAMRRAVDESGRKSAEKLMRTTAERLSAKGVRFGSGGYDPLDEENEFESGPVEGTNEPKTLSTRPYEDNLLRKVFNELDLNGNEFIEASELRHIFAQLGEMPTDNELSAMIHLCDKSGNGTVCFDDFLAIFGDPASSLRSADIKGLKRILPRIVVGFDLRDPLGMHVEERPRMRNTELIVEEVRRGAQAFDSGVKRGWKIIELEGVPISKHSVFEAKIAEMMDKIDPQKRAAAELGKKPGAAKEPAKYDFEITFAVNPGDVAEDQSQSSAASSFLGDESDGD